MTGILTGLNAMDALRYLGRWDEVEARLVELRTAVGDQSLRRWSGGLTISYGYVLVRRGRVGEARELFAQGAREMATGSYSGVVGFVTVGLVELAVHDRAWDAAREHVEQALPTLLPGLVVDAAEVVAAGLAAEADRAARQPGRTDPAAEAVTGRWLEQVRRAAPPAGSAFATEFGIWLAQAEAERCRLLRQRAAPAWERVAAVWDSYQRPYETAYAWLRAGEARLVEADLRVAAHRDQAAALLGRAHAEAGRLGAARIREQAEVLARQARLRLGEPASPSADEVPAPRPYGLTERELQVLALLAEGRSNGEIGAELFVSTKTASVHVSNILRKLGAANRIEAAAIAHRTGVLQPPKAA